MQGELHIDEFDAGSVKQYTGGPRPRPLSFWRSVLAQTGGMVPGVGDEMVPVSLDRWADADENTMLAIYVQFVDPKLVGTIDPDPPAETGRLLT